MNPFKLNKIKLSTIPEISKYKSETSSASNRIKTQQNIHTEAYLQGKILLNFLQVGREKLTHWNLNYITLSVKYTNQCYQISASCFRVWLHYQVIPVPGVVFCTLLKPTATCRFLQTVFSASISIPLMTEVISTSGKWCRFNGVISHSTPFSIESPNNCLSPLKYRNVDDMYIW